MSPKPPRAQPDPRPLAGEGRGLGIHVDGPAAAATGGLPEVRSSFTTGLLALVGGPSGLLLPGLPPGTAGLPGRQIPPRGQPAVGLAAGRHPDPTVDVPTGPVPPGSRRDAPVRVLQTAGADPRTPRGAGPEEREWPTCRSSAGSAQLIALLGCSDEDFSAGNGDEERPEGHLIPPSSVQDENGLL